MSGAEKILIKHFAAGDTSLRAKAIVIHRDEIKRTGKVRGTPEMDFMAEVDNICPDYELRATYRKKLLGK